MADAEEDEDDKALFRQAMEGVKPLQAEPRVPRRKKRRHPARLQAEEQQAVLRDMMSDEMPIDEVEAGEGLAFARPGLQHKVLRELRRGRYAIQGELDLHRMTRDQARAALVAFLSESISTGRRCVRIIHGKGHGSHNRMPVLKGLTARWLMQRDEVLAFCSARPVDGGSGAVYVLLKRG